jgi:hypothetical protein
MTRKIPLHMQVTPTQPPDARHLSTTRSISDTTSKQMTTPTLMTADGDLTCIRPASGKLRFVIVCLKPWVPIQGAAKTSCAQPHDVTAPPAFCQLPVVAGTPAGIKYSGAPLPYVDTTPPPEEIRRRFGPGPYTSMVFNFGFSPSGEASGTLTACGSKAGAAAAGCRGAGCGAGFAVGAPSGICRTSTGVQATLSFIYRWGDTGLTCTTPPVAQPQFEVTDSSSVHAQFIVLDDETYLSSSPCTDSIVVIGCTCTTAS